MYVCMYVYSDNKLKELLLFGSDYSDSSDIQNPVIYTYNVKCFKELSLGLI